MAILVVIPPPNSTSGVMVQTSELSSFFFFIYMEWRWITKSIDSGREAIFINCEFG